MAKQRILGVTPPGQANVIVEEGEASGDRNDVRTYKAPKPRVFPSMQSTDQSKVPGLQQPFQGEIGLPGARTGQRLPQNSDTMQLEYERTTFNESSAAYREKAIEALESVNAVIREDHQRRS